jgi:hypothetical protein
MGIHCYTAVAKCKLYVCSWTDKLPKTAPKGLKELYPFLNEGSPGVVMRGWEVRKWEDFDDISAVPLTKGKRKVYYLNESPYESVGGVDATFFSDDLTAMKEFCNTFKLDSRRIQTSKKGVSLQWHV